MTKRTLQRHGYTIKHSVGILSAAATLLITLGYIDDRDGKIVDVKSQNATCKSGII